MLPPNLLLSQMPIFNTPNSTEEFLIVATQEGVDTSEIEYDESGEYSKEAFERKELARQRRFEERKKELAALHERFKKEFQ